MTYETMDEVKDVYVERNDGAGVSRRDYQENSATSKFYISLSSTVKTNEEYCVFATLTDDSIDVLKALKQAIADYAEATYENASNFTSRKYGEVKDNLVGESEKAYDVPNAPIVIENAKVIKW